ncbi:unnamed protein product [Aphanomyces euteiches]|nr:hypothetical protein AeRB84_004174 [Aphanomyces euteiches]
MIKIGNKLFCKPSTQAMLGFATILPRKQQIVPNDTNDHSKRASSGSENETMTLISVYSLLPLLLSSLHHSIPENVFFHVFGTVQNNQFHPGGTQAPPLHEQNFRHHRGSCAN